MKKTLLTMICLLVFSAIAVKAETVTCSVDCAGLSNYSSSAKTQDWTADNGLVFPTTAESSTGSYPEVKLSAVVGNRLWFYNYGSNAITVNAPEGYKIAGIVINAYDNTKFKLDEVSVTPSDSKVTKNYDPAVDSFKIGTDGTNFGVKSIDFTLESASTGGGGGDATPVDCFIKFYEQTWTPTTNYYALYGNAPDNAIDWTATNGLVFATQATSAAFPQYYTSYSGNIAMTTANQAIKVNAPVGYKIQAVNFVQRPGWTPNALLIDDNNLAADATYTFDNPVSDFTVKNPTGYTYLHEVTITVVAAGGAPSGPNIPELGPVAVTPDAGEYLTGTEVTVSCPRATHLYISLAKGDEAAETVSVKGNSYTFTLDYYVAETWKLESVKGVWYTDADAENPLEDTEFFAEYGDKAIVEKTVGNTYTVTPGDLYITGALTTANGKTDNFVYTGDEVGEFTFDNETKLFTFVQTAEDNIGGGKVRLSTVKNPSSTSFYDDWSKNVVRIKGGTTTIGIGQTYELEKANEYNSAATNILLPAEWEGLIKLEVDLGSMTLTTSEVPRPATPVETIAELKELANNTAVELTTEGVTVTYARDDKAFIEDESGAVLMAVMDEESGIETGKKLAGKLAGMRVAGAFALNTEESEFTATDVDVAKGAELSIEELGEAANIGRLVTVVNSDEEPFAFNEEMGCPMVGENILFFNALDAMPEDYEFPNNLISVTGIIVPLELLGLDESAGITIIAPRGLEDVVFVPEVNVSTIAEIKALEVEEDTTIVLTTEGVNVTYSGDSAIFFEDETGAVSVGIEDENPFVTGTKLVGKLVGNYAYGYFVVNVDESEYTVEETEIVPSELSKAELLDEENAYRLVKVVSTEENPILHDEDNFGMNNGEGINFCDMWDVVEEFPAAAESVTGINLPMSGMLMDLEEDEEDDEIVMIAVRSMDDIVPMALPLEVETIAEIKGIDTEGAETELVLNTEGIVVTFTDDVYTFVEDDSDAAMNVWFVVPEVEEGEEATISRPAEGDVLSGKLAGTYISDGQMRMFSIDLENSEYTVEHMDVAEGYEMPVDEIANPANEYRLITVKNTEENPFTFDVERGAWKVGENVYFYDALDTLGWEYEWPDELEQVTGIIQIQDWDEDEEGVTYYTATVAPRSEEDIVGTYAPTPTMTVAEIKDYDWTDYKDIIVENVTVTFTIPETDNDAGSAYMQDETGAMKVITYSWDLDEAPKFSTGTKVSGKFYGIYRDGCYEAIMDYCEFDEVEVDVAKGAELTEAEILEQANEYFLVTVNSTETDPIVVVDTDDNIAMYGTKIAILDAFDVLGDYNFPEAIKQVTGIIVPMAGVEPLADGDDDQTVLVAIAPRSAEDIVKGEGGALNSIFDSNMFEGPVYNLNGVKVGESVKDLKNLAKGIYIVNGKKVYVMN